MIKSIINTEHTDKKLDYPKLMRSSTSGTVYLMMSLTSGTTVYIGNHHPCKIGFNSHKMEDILLEDFHGTITLINQQ